MTDSLSRAIARDARTAEQVRRFNERTFNTTLAHLAYTAELHYIANAPAFSQLRDLAR